MPDHPAHHPTASPSSLPMKAQCPCYESGAVGEAAERGHLQHESLACQIRGVEDPWHDQLTIEEQAQVEYACSIYQTYTGSDREVEVWMNLVEDFEELTYGTADCVYRDGAIVRIFDYKSGRKRNYDAQLACYARMAMQKYNVALAHVYVVWGRFARYDRVDLTYRDTDYVVNLIHSITDEMDQATICDYCNWCAKRDECPALLNSVVTVANGYEPSLNFDTFHPSKMEDPVQVAHGYRLAKVVAKWAESMKYHAEQKMLGGMRVPGYELEQKLGNRRFADAVDANAILAASKLSPEQFLPACKIGLGKLEKAIAQGMGYKTVNKTVQKEVNARFGALIERPLGKPSIVEVDPLEQEAKWLEEDTGSPVEVIETEHGEVVEKEVESNG